MTRLCQFLLICPGKNFSKKNLIIRIRENRGKLRSISFHLDFSKRNEMIFRNSRELTSNLACFELLQEHCEEKERGKKKSMLAINFLFLHCAQIVSPFL